MHLSDTWRLRRFLRAPGSRFPLFKWHNYLENLVVPDFLHKTYVMKYLEKSPGIKTFLLTLVFSLYTLISKAQETTSVKVDGEEIGSWLSRNWIWVAGGVVLLLIVIGALSGGSSRKKTTIVREEDANGTVRTTTTETTE